MKEVKYLVWNLKNVKLMTIPLDPMNVSPKPILIIIVIGTINGNKDLIIKIHQRLIPYERHYSHMSFKQVFKSKKQVGTLFFISKVYCICETSCMAIWIGCHDVFKDFSNVIELFTQIEAPYLLVSHWPTFLFLSG